MNRPLFPLLIQYLLLLHFSAAYDCIWQKQTFSVSSQNPINPLYNCKQYCQTFYSRNPQRAFYNQTTQDCEPMLMCLNHSHFFDYETNSCYEGEDLGNADWAHRMNTYIPESVTYIEDVHPSAKVICVNGYLFLSSVYGMMLCLCELLWEDSGLLDLHGTPFKCDTVTEKPETHFFESLEVDSASGQILKYGIYSREEMQEILRYKKIQQKNQRREYLLMAHPSVLYALEISVKHEGFLRSGEFPLLTVLLIFGIAVFCLTYYEYEQMRIGMTLQQMRSAIEKTLTQLHQHQATSIKNKNQFHLNQGVDELMAQRRQFGSK